MPPKKVKSESKKSEEPPQSSPRKFGHSNSDSYVRDIINPLPLTGGEFLKIMSWNVAGLAGILRKDSNILHRLTEIHKPDILCLQETKLQHSDEHDNVLEHYNSFWIFSEKKKGYSGNVVFVRKDIPYRLGLQRNGSRKGISDHQDQTGKEKEKGKEKGTKGTQQSLFQAWGGDKKAKGKGKGKGNEEESTQKEIDSQSELEPSSSPSSSSSSSDQLISPITSSSSSELSSFFPSSPPEGIEVKGVQYELADPSLSGEGRVISMDFGLFLLVASYVPNSGMALDRLDYRLHQWDPFMFQYLRDIHLHGLPSSSTSSTTASTAPSHLTTKEKADKQEEEEQQQQEKGDDGKPVVWLGDLNVCHLDIDIHNPDAKHIAKQAGLTPQERESFDRFLFPYVDGETGQNDLREEEEVGKSPKKRGKKSIPTTSVSTTPLSPRSSVGFVDAFRFLYPGARGQFAYWSMRTNARPVNRGLRLDYFICSQDLFGDPLVEASTSTSTSTESTSEEREEASKENISSSDYLKSYLPSLPSSPHQTYRKHSHMALNLEKTSLKNSKKTSKKEETEVVTEEEEEEEKKKKTPSKSKGRKRGVTTTLNEEDSNPPSSSHVTLLPSFPTIASTALTLHPTTQLNPPSPCVYDSYIVHNDTVGFSDHCPIVLVLKIR